MTKVQPRDVSPMIQIFRNFLLGRTHTTALRYEADLATRSPPPPAIPDGPCHNLSANYYCDRDVRREVEPPTIIASNKIALEAGGSQSETSGPKKLPTPGNVYHWD